VDAVTAVVVVLVVLIIVGGIVAYHFLRWFFEV
jgi:hypothetical protein